MSKAELVITAVAAAAYGVSKGWVSKLMARYRAEGEAAFEPRSRAPRTSPSATPPGTVQLVLQLRKKLSEQGLDAGADTIGWHLADLYQVLKSMTADLVVTRPSESYTQCRGKVLPPRSSRPTVPSAWKVSASVVHTVGPWILTNGA